VDILGSDILQKVYDEEYDRDYTLKQWREMGGKYKARNIRDLCTAVPKNKVLEVGAGEGGILMWLDQMKFSPEMHALEISKTGIHQIEERKLPSVKEARQFDGYHIPYDTGYFDLAILFHVLEHVEHPRLLLREIKRVARYVIIEVPCDFSFDVDKKTDLYLSYGHINVFSSGLVRFLLQSEGFEILNDKLQITPFEVMKFLKCDRQGKKQNPFNHALLKLRHIIKLAIFSFGNAYWKERLAYTYTVLVKSLDRGLKISGECSAITEIKGSIKK